jgi:UDP-glucose 4-epimerase
MRVLVTGGAGYIGPQKYAVVMDAKRLRLCFVHHSYAIGINL